MKNPFPSFLKKAKSVLPDSCLLESPEDCGFYASDWTKTPGRADAVALPRTTEDVVKILRLCSQEGIPVVPSGGRTGLAGGAVASSGELVLSLSRMNQMQAVDFIGRTVRVQAGATTQAVHEHCAPLGLTWPIDLASKGTSQIGGNLATNAGGVRVIRYGMARKWVSGLQAVTMEGEVLELNNRLEKNNTGYDLIQCLVGSEGTLAVTTEATLKLTAIPRHVVGMLFAVETLQSIAALLEKARCGPFEILAFEFFSELCLRTVEGALGRRCRLKRAAPFYVLIEIEMPSSSADAVESWLGEVLDQGMVTDGMLALTSSDQREVWGLREGITESLSRKGSVRKYDVSVPVMKMVDFLSEACALLRDPSFLFELYVFGHFGDGSPHLNLVQAPGVSAKEFEASAAIAEQALFPLLKRYSGSLSAEHGVGLLKKEWVKYSRTPEELRLYRAIKAAFDPRGLLNPGKLIGA